MSNVLLIVADDLRADLLRFMPFVSGQLRAEGTQFTGFRCPTPLCSPARASLITGQYSKGSVNGVYLNDVTDVVAPDVYALPPWLTSAGITTGMFGKYTKPGQNTAPSGWSEWKVLTANTQTPYSYVVRNGVGTDITPSPRPHQLVYLQDVVSTFITTAAEPWFCWFAPTNPHIDTNTLDNNPLPASHSRYGWINWGIDLLTTTTGKPSWITALPQFSYSDQSLMRNNIRQMIREARDLDDSVAALYANLVSAGRLADTTIIFTSDSGVHFGEQRLGSVYCAGKGTPYEPSMLAPCIIRGPGFPAGHTVSAPTIMPDITTTICNIFGASPNVTLDGVDLRYRIDPDRATLYQHTTAVAELPPGNGVVTATRKLIRWTGQTGNDQYEMYDLDTDPGEKTNVANDSGRLTERNALEARLNALLA